MIARRTPAVRRRLAFVASFAALLAAPASASDVRSWSGMWEGELNGFVTLEYVLSSPCPGCSTDPFITYCLHTGGRGTAGEGTAEPCRAVSPEWTSLEGEFDSAMTFDGGAEGGSYTFSFIDSGVTGEWWAEANDRDGEPDATIVLGGF